MKILINFADDKFAKQQKLNSKSGYKKGGFDKVIEYNPSSLGEDFTVRHKEFLEVSNRGAGYWLWKPYIILKTLEDANEGDYVFYCDSGSIFINSIDHIINAMEQNNQSIFLTELPLLEKQWTKMECFHELKCMDEKYRETPQVIATYIMLKKDENSIKLMNEYYNLCCKYQLLDDSKEMKQDPKFIDHRHDQSLLSLLAKMNNVSFHRDITQYGIRPFLYTAAGREYMIKSYRNSSYPQILLSYRKGNWLKVLIKEKFKDYLGFNLRLG
ncbi:hypothetical protein BVG16_06995 [Paenibacillus selenitireducens]|uniref:Uncharacterized protein n=1 Tax=Paenibacillus selenitireducens TaxID=1324314 RepID=A0A1T2XKY3_9BACL|nr:hypothetical protein [Paenibacillus selenitireducens]OPA80468.1 hypothetical protein BVG16_06995 [Paenibacillus selenitireducens]